jgi:hypothetical protein
MLRAALDLNLLEEQTAEECATLYDPAPQIALPLYRLRYRSIAIESVSLLVRVGEGRKSPWLGVAGRPIYQRRR